MAGVTYTEILKDSSNNPLSGVMVALYLDGVRQDVETTDKYGRFTFTGVTTGYYQLRFYGRGYTEDDWRYVTILDEIEASNFRPEIRLERLLAMFNSIGWASRAFIEACIDDEFLEESSTLVRLSEVFKPSVTAASTSYVYETTPINLNLTSPCDKATLVADFSLEGNANIKIETTLSGTLDANWYTWVNTEDTEIIGSGEHFPNGYRDLRNFEVTTSGVTTSGINIPGFVPGVDVAVKVTITSDSNANAGYLTSLALFMNPDPTTQ